VIDTVQPLLSKHFNLTVELPLKAITRGHTYAVVPISWRNRRAGESKLDLREMGSRYLFIVLYVFLEAHLSRGDYRRSDWEQLSPKRDHRARLLPRRGVRADPAGSPAPRPGGSTT
jgi:dolichol-phosphate mannosyltransferase